MFLGLIISALLLALKFAPAAVSADDADDDELESKENGMIAAGSGDRGDERRNPGDGRY